MGHSKISTSKTDFFYLLFRGFILVLLPILVISTLLLSTSYSSASSNSSSDKVSLSVPVSCNLTASIASGKEHTISMISGTYESEIGETILKTSCNDANGYIVYAIGNTDNVEGKNTLSGIVGSDYDIPTGTATSGNVSQWAMKLSPIASSTASDTPVITPGYDNYHIIPNTWTKVVSKSSGTINMTTGSSFATTYAIYLQSTQPAGTYSGQVEYVMFHPSTAAEPTDTLEHAFVLAGKSKVQVTDPITGQSGSFYKMQDMTTNICESTTLVDEQNTLQLVDIRDNKLYWVTKLRDGHCWMTQNLDLDLSHSTALTSETTDLNDNSLMGAYSMHYSYDPDTRVISWIPENATRDYNTGTGTAWANNNNKAYSMDIGEWYWDGDDSTPDCNYLTTTCEHFSQTMTTSNKRFSVGNYYNWSAAIASDDSSSLTVGTYNDISNNPQNSICPKGWRLPTISNMAYAADNSTSEFGKLNVLYNESKTNTDIDWLVAPLRFVRSGYINSTLQDSGSAGRYLSSTVRYNDGIYYLSFSRTVVGPSASQGYGDRGYGLSIRCLAR